MDEELRTSREHEGSQHRMKQHACKPRLVKERMVCRCNFSTNMSRYSVSNKIVSKFYGPFKVLERIGSVAAYGLKLPPDSKMDCYTVVWQLGPESWPAGRFLLYI